LACNEVLEFPTHGVIVGAGAIGCIYGWRLSHNADVMTVCRSNYHIVNQEGFIIDSEKWGEGVFRPARGNEGKISIFIDVRD
jgi:ketopantoate reductase